MRLSARALDRTLLLRQHLLERRTGDPLAMVEHLIGLQAQDNLPPYLSLAARLDSFDPHRLSAALAERRAVRFFSMRGTVHLMTRDDALTLRRWVQPMLDRLAVSNGNSRPAAHLAGPDLVAETADLVAAEPLPVKRIGELLAERHPGVPAGALAHLARELTPLVQVPPRGMWRRSGGVVHSHVEQWLGAPQRDLDVPGLVRRYLAAYGPGTAADVTAWSGVTRLGPVLEAMADGLDVHEGPDGKPLYDVPGAPLADEDADAPVRLLGKYDDLWLSHASKERVVSRADRPRWMAANGGAGNVLLADGAMAGLWYAERPSARAATEVRVEPWRRLTRSERAGLEEEIERTRALLDRPPHDAEPDLTPAGGR